MARKRKAPKPASRLSEQDQSDGDAEPNPESEDFMYDAIDKFHQRDDKISFNQNDDADSNLESEDEEEVMGLDSASSDEEEDNFEEGGDASDEDASLGDSASDDEQGLPSDKAWGKSKNLFYSTDLIDEDMLGSDEEAETAAQEEEEEALSMQKQLTSRLEEDDFDVFSIGKLLPEDVDESELLKATDSQIVKDLSTMSREEKLELLVKESPELFEMLDEFKGRLAEVTGTYHPLLLMVKEGAPISKKGKLFIEAKHQALLNYCTNLGFYLTLKANKELSKSHPVIARLVQYRMILQELDKVSETHKLQISELLHTDPSTYRKSGPKSNRELLKSLVRKSKKKRSAVTDEQEAAVNEMAIDPMDYYNHVKAIAEDKKAKKAELHQKSVIPREAEDQFEDGKRGITNEMQKNKGLTKKRRKELQNPRVKHKLKFRKAIIRRKGQVRAVVKEMSRYGGEATGIKASLTRSVRIK